MYPPRYPMMTTQAAEQMAKDFYKAVSKVHEFFFAVKFEDTMSPGKPLVVFPPKGVAARDYREALLRRADFETLESLSAADCALKAHIKEAFAKNDGAVSERTIARSLINTVLSHDL